MPGLLLDLIDKPLSKKAGIYTFSEMLIENGFPSKYLEENDLVGIECGLNKVNLIDYAGKSLPLTASSLLKTGLKFSFLLNKKLENENNDERFKIIFSFRISRYVDAVVFFHKIRKNSIDFISHDFEKQPSVDGILTIDTGRM